MSKVPLGPERRRKSRPGTHSPRGMPGRVRAQLPTAISVLIVAWMGWITFGRGSSYAWQLALAVGTAAVGFLVVLVVPRRTWAAIFQRNFALLPVLIGAGSYWYFHWYANQMGDVSSAFYEMSSQILPVFLLAITIDVRRSQTLQSTQLALPFTFIIMGELIALNTAAFGGGETADFALVASALSVAVSALLIAVLANYDDGEGRDERAKTVAPTVSTRLSDPADSAQPD